MMLQHLITQFICRVVTYRRLKTTENVKCLALKVVVVTYKRFQIIVIFLGMVFSWLQLEVQLFIYHYDIHVQVFYGMTPFETFFQMLWWPVFCSYSLLTSVLNVT